jgi:uncharacterized protein with ACT and thioredoxin-like domain
VLIWVGIKLLFDDGTDSVIVEESNCVDFKELVNCELEIVGIEDSESVVNEVYSVDCIISVVVEDSNSVDSKVEIIREL